MGVLRTPLKLTGTPTPDRVRGRLFILSHQGGGDRIPTSRIARVIVAAFLSVIAVGIETHAHAEKIRTAIPQANLNYLSIYVADGRGYFKDEGLENETVVISGPLATAALLSGDVDFSGGGGSGMRAALKGAPVIPSAEGIKNFLEYDIKIPLGFEEDIPPERLLQLQLV